MKKLLFPGAFAMFAFRVCTIHSSACHKKAKTEQTASKDAQKPACTKGDKATATSPSLLLPKGASASTNAKGSSYSKSASAGCCSKSAMSASADTQEAEVQEKVGNTVTGMNDGN